MKSREPLEQRSLMQFLIWGGWILAFLSIGGFASAQTGTLFVEGDNVGIGTAEPASSLHIQQVGATLNVVDSSGASEARTLLRLINKGRINFNLFNSDTNENWQFSNTLVGFQINETISPGVEFRLTTAGDLFLEGTVHTSSSRGVKNDQGVVDAADVLAKLAAVPVSKWTYLDSTVSHIGPMAEDFYAAFGVGHDAKSLSPSDTSGVALAAIQGLDGKVREKEHEIAQLRSELQEQAALIATLSERLSELERRKN